MTEPLIILGSGIVGMRASRFKLVEGKLSTADGDLRMLTPETRPAGHGAVAAGGVRHAMAPFTIPWRITGT